MVRLSSLIVLLVTLFILIRCTQVTSDQEADDDSGQCTFSFNPSSFLGNSTSFEEESSECTTVGVQVSWWVRCYYLVLLFHC